MLKYELQGITPFNDVYYVDCDYLAFFTALKYYNGSIYSYMANGYFIYTLDNTQKGLTLKIKGNEVLSFLEITEYNCINAELTFNYRQDIIEYIKDSILGGSIIILPVDGFYYKHPYHDLFYQKEHHNNTMLIYGFDSERDVFKTTETNGFQWNTKNCHYKHEISYKELFMGHEGAARYLQTDPPHPIIMKLSKSNSEKEVNYNPRFYENTLIKNLKDHKDAILKGLDNISFVLANMNQLDLSETTSFNNLVASASNQYRIKHILGEECKYLPTLENIVNTWATIRNLLLKYEFKGVELDKNIIISKLRQIYELENSLYEGLFSWLETV